MDFFFSFCFMANSGSDSSSYVLLREGLRDFLEYVTRHRPRVADARLKLIVVERQTVAYFVESVVDDNKLIVCEGGRCGRRLFVRLRHRCPHFRPSKYFRPARGRKHVPLSLARGL